MSSLVEKMEGEVEIKSSAEKFHEVFGSRPHHVSIMTDKVHGCDLHAGGFGQQHSVVTWTYTDDGKTKKTAKEIFKEIDDANKSTTLKVIEGDLLKDYKSFKLIVKATPKDEESVVSWTLEYEKIKPNTPNPIVLLDYLLHISKDIDLHLQNN